MNNPDQINQDNPLGLAIDELTRIDEICERIEEKLRSGEYPQIEKQLDGIVNLKMRSVLLTELLLLEIDYRTKRRQSTCREDYLKRFPDDGETVENVFSNRHEQTLKDSRDSYSGRELPVSHLNFEYTLKLDRFHARGGLGRIFVAHDAEHNRRVAVKIPRKRNPNDADLRRIAHEAQITAQLEHPGIVPVYATRIEKDGIPCFVMQFVEGQTLSEATRTFHNAEKQPGNPYRSFEFRQLLHRMISVCNTIAYAHQHGVIHRDIKPSNIMLDQFGKTIILDWGLAKALNHSPGIDNGRVSDAALSFGNTEISLKGQAVGTPEFASPEQLLSTGDDHNETSDVYSIGATLYFLLTGSRQFVLKQDQCIDSSLFETIKSARACKSQVPPELDAICQKAMSLEQSDRYANAKDIADEIERYLAGETTSVYQEPIWMRIQRLVFRLPKTFAAIAAGLVVGLVGLSIGTILLGSKNIELAHATNEVRNSRDQAMSSLAWLTDHGLDRAYSNKLVLDESETKFLDEVLRQYQDYANLQSNRENADAIRAEGFFRIAQVHDILGNNQEALDAAVKSNLLFSALSGDANADLKLLAARSRHHHGDLLRQNGKFEEAEKTILNAHKQITALIGSHPDEQECRFRLAGALSNLTRLLCRQSKDKQAIKYAEEGIKLAGELSRLDPGNARYRSLHAALQNNLALSLQSSGNTDLALQSLLKAEDLESTIIASKNATPAERDFYCRILANIGRHYQQSKHFELAKQYLNKAIEQNQLLCDQHPNIAEFVHHLGICQLKMAVLNIWEKEMGAARRNLEFAKTNNDIAITASPMNVDYQQAKYDIHANLGYVLKYSGQHRNARSEYRNAISAAKSLLDKSKIELHIRNLANAHFYLAKTFNDVETIDEATSQFELAAKQLRDFSNLDKQDSAVRKLYWKIHVTCANKLARWGKHEEAVRWWQTAIEFSTGNQLFEKSGMAVSLAAVTPCLALEKCIELDGLADEENTTPEVCLNLAGAFASAADGLESDSKTTAEQGSLKWLRRLRKTGYFSSEKKLNSLRFSKQFRHLTDHDEFDEFFEEIKSELQSTD